MSMTAPRRIRYHFWVVLGVLSTVIPEVIAGSDLYPFFQITDYLLLIPLYSLHCIILWYTVWRNGKPRLYNLFPAGAIFGLYEAYLTKVIWNPTWAAAPLKVGGIAVVETLVLVLFWHSFLAFIVPLLVAESLTGSEEVVDGIPEWLGNRLSWFNNGKRWYLIPLFAGLFQSINTPSLQDSLLSGLTCTIITYGIIQSWRRTDGPTYSMRQLLPTRREFNTLFGVTILLYALMGVFWRPEALPGISGQASVWALYLFFGVLLYLGLRKSNNDQSTTSHKISFQDQNMLVFGAIFTAGSVLGKITGLNLPVVYLVWFGGILFGLVVLFDTMKKVLKP